MPGFKTEREAKDFLASCIVAQAEREGTPLTEVERKMLYFSETGWTLPNILEVNAEFERDYDENEYEQKIKGIIRGIQERFDAQSDREREAWDEATLKLGDGDHYLLGLIDEADSRGNAVSSFLSRLGPWMPVLDGPVKRDPNDLKRLILVALALSFVAFIVMIVVAIVR
jgi:hypothetical protein